MRNHKIHNNLKTIEWTRQSAPNNNSYRLFICTVLFIIQHLFYLILYSCSHRGSNCMYIGIVCKTWQVTMTSATLLDFNFFHDDVSWKQCADRQLKFSVGNHRKQLLGKQTPTWKDTYNTVSTSYFVCLQRFIETKSGLSFYIFYHPILDETRVARLSSTGSIRNKTTEFDFASKRSR